MKNELLINDDSVNIKEMNSAIAAWAEDDFRSVNGQIEYILTECVKQRKKNGGYIGREIDKPLEVEVSEFDTAGE